MLADHGCRIHCHTYESENVPGIERVVGHFNGNGSRERRPCGDECRILPLFILDVVACEVSDLSTSIRAVLHTCSS
jgi:hypothetical protein